MLLVDLIGIQMDPSTGVGALVLREHETSLQSASFSPDGRHVVTASWDKTVRVWRVNDANRPLVARLHQDRVVDAR